jgi:List-Bact-rpt repeat protein
MLERKLLVLMVFASLVLSHAYGQSATLSIGTASGTPGSTVSIGISLDSTPGSEPAALQWTFSYSPTDVSGIAWTVGAAAADAGKSISCSENSCILYGPNENTISNGIVAVASVWISPTTIATTIPIQITGVVAASGAGDIVPSFATSGSITISQDPPTLSAQDATVQVSALACTPANLVSGGSSVCTVTLGTATDAGTAVAVSSTGSALTIPSIVPIPPGANSATFPVTAGIVPNDQSASITASVNGSAATADLALFDSQHLELLTGYTQKANQLRNNFDGWVGTWLTVGPSSLNVTSLGRVCVAGNAAIHALKLVNAATWADVPGGSVLVNMSNCVPGQFQYALLPNPLTLQKGTSYYLASEELAGGDQWYDHGTVSTTTAATLINAIYSYDGAHWLSISSANMSYGPVNLRYSVASSKTSSVTVSDATVPVVITTNLSGLSFSVDGAAYNSAQTFAWTPGSSHIIAATSLQSGPAGTRYSWSGWTDGGTISHSVNPTTATTISANFTTQYLLTSSVTPAGSGSITANPPSLSGYYDSGTSVQVTAVPIATSTLATWSGDLSGTANPQTVTMSAPHAVAASFTLPTGVSSFVTGVNGASLRNDFGGWVGMKITVGPNALNVLALGRLCFSGNNQTHTIKLVSANNSADVSGGSVLLNLSGCNEGQFVYNALPSAVTLQAGQSYYLVTQEFAGGDQWYNHGNIFTTPVAGVNNSVYSYDGATWIPIDGANTSYAPPSFEYSIQKSTSISVSSSAPSPGFITAYAQNGPSLRNDFGGWVGATVTVGGASLRITSLGRLCVTGNASNHAVKLVNPLTRADVPGGSATVNMSGCTPGQFQYAALSNPPTLLSGASYYIATQESAGGDRWYDYGTVSTTPVAAVSNPAFSYDGSTWITFPFAGKSYGPPDFQYTVQSTPSSGPLAPFVTGFNLNSPPLRNNFSGWVGMAFTVASTPLNITSLGRVCLPGNSGVHTIKLVNADTGMDVSGGSLTLNMSGCTQSQLQYATLSNPTTLPAGGHYYLVSQESFGGDQWYDFAPITTTGSGSVTSAVYSYAGTSWIRIGSPNYSYGPVSFK